MSRRWGPLLLPGALALVAAKAEAASLTIEHQPPACVLADQFTRLEACARPAADLVRARVFFQAEGASYWSYAEMTPAGSCLGAVLPRPSRSTRGVVYYIVAEDRTAEEAQTPEHRLEVVDQATRCRGGVVAPVASVASIVVGHAPGAPAVPQGFAKTGIAGGGMSTGLTVATVVGSGVAVGGLSTLVAKGDSPARVSTPSSSPPQTIVGTPPTNPGTPPPSSSPGTTPGTTLPPGTTPPSTITPPPTTAPPPSTTPPSTTPPSTSPPSTTGCGDGSPPSVEMTSPGNGPLNGATALLEAVVSDPGSGVREVRFFARATNTGEETEVGSDSDAPYSAIWNLPGCNGNSADPYKLWARAEDNCGNEAESAKVNVVLCAQSASGRSIAGATWIQRVDVPGGSGQSVLNGSIVSYARAGATQSPFALREGENRVVATLVEGRGEGTWRFDLPAGAIEPGSLVPVAGNVSLLGPDSIAFKLSGRAGEQVAFRFRASRAPNSR